MLRHGIALSLALLSLLFSSPAHAEIKAYANAGETPEEVRRPAEPDIPVMSVKTAVFHDRGSILTMKIPSTYIPFGRQHLRNGDTVFINKDFANYYTTPLALVMMLVHFAPMSDEQSKTFDQRLDDMSASFTDTVMTSAKIHDQELLRSESLLQNGCPARRVTIRSLTNGQEIITDTLFLSYNDDIWSIQLMYDTSDPIIPYHAASLLSAATISESEEK